MGQAKQRGTREERAAQSDGTITISHNSHGQWLRKRNRWLHITMSFVYDEEKKMWKMRHAPMQYEPKKRELKQLLQAQQG